MRRSSRQGLAPLHRMAGAAAVCAALAALPAVAQDQGAAGGGDTTVSHGFSNFGELKYPDGFAHLDYVNPEAPKGGEISLWSQGNFDSFNQYARQGVPAALNTIGSESILTQVADDPFGLYCLLCESIEYPESRDWVTFNLREDVTFQDGTPMTAEDVEFSFNLFLEQGIAEYRRIVEGFIESVEVEGPHTITFNFTEEAPVRDRIGFAGGTPVFSEAWFEETGARLDESTDQPFMSTGPYVLDSFDYNTQVIYARDEDYWGADLPINVGRHNFDRIRVEYFADSSAALEGFKSGAYTFRTESSAQDWATGYENFRAMENGWVVREEIPDGSVGIRQSFVFNLDRAKWQDERVRDAIAMMFNFEWSNQTLFYGLYERPASFWPNTELAAEGPPSEAEVALLQPLVDEGLLSEEILTEPADTPVEHEASTAEPSRRIFREASRLLDEAGWETGSDGLRRNADGEVLSLVNMQYNPLFDRIINPFNENLRRLGIRAELQRVDTAQYVERRRAGNFDMTTHAIQMNFEPSIGLQQWYASFTADDSSRNLMRLRDPAVDRLIEEVISASTLDELTTSVHALDRVLREIGFAIPQWYNRETWVAYYDMYEHPEALPPLETGELDFWWYDAERAEELRAAGAIQ